MANGINAQGQVVHDNQEIKSSMLVKALQSYFQQQPDGLILVATDKSLAYSKVTQTFKGLRSLGGKRVSLAVEPFEEESQITP